MYGLSAADQNAFLSSMKLHLKQSLNQQHQINLTLCLCATFICAKYRNQFIPVKTVGSQDHFKCLEGVSPARTNRLYYQESSKTATIDYGNVQQ